MRIIIEFDPSELKPSVTVEGVKAPTIIEETTDAGGPPEFLVEALGGKKEPESETTRVLDQNGGAGPVWLTEATEAFVSSLALGGNGGGDGSSPVK